MRTTLLWLTGVILVASACASQTSPSTSAPAGPVAIVDLDEVFRRIGREATVEKELADKKTELDGRLAKLQEALRKEREAKAKEFGETPTAEQSQELEALSIRLTTQFGQEQRRAQREFEMHRVSLVRRFREEVRPVARDVAAARGRDIVLTKTDMVLVAPDEAIITEAVVERMLENSSGGAKKKE